MARESLVDTIVVVTDDNGHETECDMDKCSWHMDEEFSESLAIGKAVRSAIMGMQHDGATVTVKVYAR